MELTVTAHFTRAILNTLAQTSQALPAGLQARLQQFSAQERLPLSVLDELWDSCQRLSGDPLFGLKAGLSVQPGDLDVVGFLLMSCETLGDALEALLDYHRIVGEGGDFSMTRRGQDCHIIYAPQYEICRDQRVQAVMASSLAMTRWLTGNAFSARRIAFAHPAPPDPRSATQLMGCELQWDQVADVLVFDQSQLALPIVQANAQVFERMRVLADEALEKLQRSSFSRSVAELIRAHPAHGKDDIADQLHMSGRHLNRKLADEGGSFKLLQDSVRASLAEQWLDAGRHPLDIASALGFADERSFTKAFKRWRNQTPAQFRAR